jgi:3-hydroxyisobutyrate dehydrogenase-like beta-hydroxyacid dehydrogenase
MASGSTVGLVGIGLMGEAIAERLLSAGVRVLGFDLDASRNARLAERGGIAAASLAEVAHAADPIIIAVFSTDQVEDVVGSLLPHMAGTGKAIVCTSTCDPDRVAVLAARVTAQGVRFVEAPVSGTSEQVRRGQGVGLIGGEAETVVQLEPVLKTVFPTLFHVGRAGDGGRAKLAVNLILGLNRLALAEGLVFAERLGLDANAFLAVARGSAAYSQVMDTKGPKMVRRDFTPEGRVRQTLKDVHLMLDQARRLGQPLPTLAVHGEVLEALVARGEGDLDNSAVFREIERRADNPAESSSESR